MVTKEDIHNFLKSVGVKSTDTLLIHTSMRAIGQVENGCDGLVDGFISYLHNGLFLVPTHTWDILDTENPTFDVRSSLSCIGALPDTAIKRADGVRSLHPTHSLKAFGKRAEEYVQGEENATTPCPVGGAWARLRNEDAVILLIGVGLNRLTYIHAVDEMLDLPDRLVSPKKVTLIDYDGNEKQVLLRGHGAISSTYFGNYQKPFERLGALSFGKLGNATVGILRARKVTEIMQKLWSVAEYPLCDTMREIPEKYYL
jgi:aminoglycoside 3-N-acetyltransferase